MTRRIVRLGDCSVAIVVPRAGDRMAERVADVVVPGCRPGDGHADVAFELASSGESLTLSRSGSCIVENRSPGFVAHVLLDEISSALSSHSRRGVALHAAAVGLGGAAILVPGSSGAGKSTLAASLVRRGLTFIGDELIHLSNGTVQSFSRPFAFKQGGVEVLSRWVDVDGDDTLRTPIGLLVHPRLIGQFSQAGPCHVARIVFPERGERAEFVLEPLSRAATALRLMASVVNGGNVDRHGFDDIVRLSSDVPGHRLIYSDADDVTIEALVTST